MIVLNGSSTPQEEFVRVVEQKREAMYRLARMMLRSDADAEDAVSAATVSAWARLDRIRNMSALPAYLMRCVLHACHTALRQRKREIPAGDLEPLLPPREPETPMWMYLSRLPEKFRLPIALRYGENLSLSETARILRIPQGTVSSRCSRGLEMFKQQLTKEGPGYD